MTPTNEPRPATWWLAGDDIDAVLAQLDEHAGPASDDRPVSRVDHLAGAGPVRLGIVDPDPRKLRLARRLVAKGEPWHGRSDIWFAPDGLAATGKVVFMFPGVEPASGSDAIDLPGLGAALGIDAPHVSYDTVAHQGASIFELGLFLDAALRILGVEPDIAAGHSVGEWAGTVSAGMLGEDNAGDFLGALDLHGVVLPNVDFAAITAAAGAVAPVIESLADVVISHDNCPNQTIICGPPAEIDTALARLRDERIIGQKLPFQSGFHTPAIAPALDTLRQMISGLPLGPGRIPMWSATLAAPYPDDAAEIRELFLRHLVEPVRFRELVEHLYDDAGARIFVQLGTGSLVSFVDDTLRSRRHAAVEVLNPKRSALAQMHRALTALWVEGIDVRPGLLAAPTGAPEPAAVAPAPANGVRASGTNGHAAPAHPTLTQPVHAEPLAQAPAAQAPAAHQAPATAPAHQAPATAPAHQAPATAPAHEAPAAAAAPPAVPYTLLAATDLLTQAAAAGQQVLDALAAHWSLPPMTARDATRDAVEAAGRLAARPAAPPPAAPPPPAPPAPAVTPAPEPAPAPASPPPGQPTTAWPTGTITVTEHLSLETRPETIDHSLNEVPDGWDDKSDGFPIMAMTTQIDLLQKIAEPYGDGRDIVEVFDVRAMRWLDLSDPIDVEITITPQGDDVLSLSMLPYCRMNVRFGRYAPAPPYEERPFTNSRPTTYTAAEMFEKRLMFHGPRFQGVDEMGPIGDEGMLGLFTHLDTPGSLLDNLGKLVAYWVIDTRDYIGEGALPTNLERVEFFGPEPEPGTKVRCDIRIVELLPNQVRSDGVLVLPDGRIWCRVENWTSLVFHLDELMERVYHDAGNNQLVEPQPGGWYVVRERWPTGAARDMVARRSLGRRERERYATMSLAEQRRWLLDTIAAKDSVRFFIKHVFDATSWSYTMWVEPDGGRNRYKAMCDYFPDDLDLRVTLSPLNWVTVAIVSWKDLLDIEARVVPDDADDATAERIAREAAAALAERNPGVRIAWVKEPEYTVTSFGSAGPRFAVAWTERDDEGHLIPLDAGDPA